MARSTRFPRRFRLICDSLLERTKGGETLCKMGPPDGEWEENNLKILNGLVFIGAITKRSKSGRWYHVVNRELLMTLLNNPPASNDEEWTVYLHTRQVVPTDTITLDSDVNNLQNAIRQKLNN